ncbi:MAG: NUDIX domain-containing protein [Patescibacteria group bacterium]
MDGKITRGLILLTYKGKALLMNKSNSSIDREKHPWCFIGGVKGEAESFENAMKRRVETETGIAIKEVELISESCYHARLTDDDVNRIKREENQLLDFFTIKDIRKLFLSNTTAQFVSKHSELI